MSIVMPVYNGGAYLELALRSAIAQTYANTEIVLVNDGSNDGGVTRAIAQKFSGSITYVEQENKGVAGALNSGLRHATGDFFSWLSHDDIYLPHKTATQVEYHGRLGNPDASVFSNFYHIDEDGRPTEEQKLNRSAIIRAPLLPLLRGYINGCTLLVPMHVMREFGEFSEDLRYTQDYDFWNRIISRYDFFHLPETLVGYRVHSEQGTQKEDVSVETNLLWKKLIDSRSEIERVQTSGSAKRFLVQMADFLEQARFGDRVDEARFPQAERYARRAAELAESDALVSVVLPVGDDIAGALRTARSILLQTHARLELILVAYGSGGPLGEIWALAESDCRVRLIQQGSDLGAARNRGLQAAQGSYIALASSDSLFTPQKIQAQLAAMQDSGSVLSHTSYLVSFSERFAHLAPVASGLFDGRVYPAIKEACPILPATVMLHRSLVTEGFAFDSPDGGDLSSLFFVDVAQQHPVLGINESLSVVEWGTTSPVLDLHRRRKSEFLLAERLGADPMHATPGRSHVSDESIVRPSPDQGSAESLVPPFKGELDEALIAEVFSSRTLDRPGLRSESEDAEELRLRRAHAAARAQGHRGQDQSQRWPLSLFRRRLRYDIHVDTIAGQPVTGSNWILAEFAGAEIVMAGWFRPIGSWSTNPSLTVEIVSSSATESVTLIRKPRLDVALAFELPEDVAWGFVARIPRAKLERGDPTVMAVVDSGAEGVTRLPLGRFVSPPSS